jgi:hypothetical protein
VSFDAIVRSGIPNFIGVKHKNPIIRFLLNIRKLFHRNSNPSELKDSNELLGHISICCLIACDPLVALPLLGDGITASRVGTKTEEIDLLLISGNLGSWKSAVLNAGAKVSSNRNVRHLAETIVKEFDKFGLSILFSDYHRKQDENKIFYLEHK